MFQIRAEQYAAMRRKRLGDELITNTAVRGFDAVWGPKGETVQIKDPIGDEALFGFDEGGFFNRFISPSGRRWQFTNDPNGKPASLATPSGYLLDMGYDTTGSLTFLRSSTRQEVRLLYDQSGKGVGAQYADGTWETVEYTPWNAPAAAVDRLGRRISAAYDSRQRPVELTDGNGQTTKFVYRGWKWPAAIAYPNGATERFRYDARGYLSGISQGDSFVAVACNEQGQPSSLRYQDGTKITFEYDDQGRVIAATAGDVSSTVSWNDQGQLEKDVTAEIAQEFSYDAAGRLIGITSSTGETISYAWDADSRLSAFTDWNGDVHSIEYASKDRGMVRTSPAGTRSFVGLEPSGRLESLDVAYNGRSLFSIHNSYNADARLATSKDSVFGDRSYAYDAEGQVLRCDSSEPRCTENFSYDQAGNHTSISGLRTNLDSANQMTGVGDERLTYDLRGNVIRRDSTDGTWVYTYNGRNQMVKVLSPAGQITEYAYDAFHRRLLKRTQQHETHFVWAGELLVAEVVEDLSSGKQIRQDFLYRPGSFVPMATRIGKQVYDYHTDHLGRPRAITSRTGELVWVADYSVYGKARVIKASVANPLRAPGQ